jgi:hypothetical protein
MPKTPEVIASGVFQFFNLLPQLSQLLFQVALILGVLFILPLGVLAPCQRLNNKNNPGQSRQKVADDIELIGISAFG